ncbi:MAG: hypothetical protein M1833_006758 [Piccolia ochrophora]|nr:MAG: hypothetical protein M1833_006758 [Piccolia ochrophora]
MSKLVFSWCANPGSTYTVNKGCADKVPLAPDSGYVPRSQMMSSELECARSIPESALTAVSNLHVSRTSTLTQNVDPQDTDLGDEAATRRRPRRRQSHQRRRENRTRRLQLGHDGLDSIEEGDEGGPQDQTEEKITTMSDNQATHLQSDIDPLSAASEETYNSQSPEHHVLQQPSQAEKSHQTGSNTVQSPETAPSSDHVSMTKKEYHDPIMDVDQAELDMHSFTLTWISAEEKEFQRFKGVSSRLIRMAPDSFVIPRTFSEWLAHRVAVLEANKRALLRKISNRQAMIGIPKVMPIFGGKIFSGDRGTVLSQQTIWTPCATASQSKGAAWPSMQEMKWEGDDRAKTGVRRFPPIPREPGNETVAWHQLRAQKANDLDQVRKVPTREDIEDATSVDESLPFHLVGSDIWDAIEESVEDDIDLMDPLAEALVDSLVGLGLD